MQQLIDIDRDTAAASECAEAEAGASFMLGGPSSYSQEHGITALRIGGSVAVTFRTLDSPLFNRVVGLGLREPATEALLDEVLSIYEAFNIRKLGIQVSPFAEPPELGRWLENRGFEVASWSAKFWRGPEPATPTVTDLRIEEIGRGRAGEFVRVVREGFGMPELIDTLAAGVIGAPGWRMYLAYDGDQAVACAAMHILDDVAWIGTATTVPSHRGRGAQGALISRRIADGLGMGCRLFTVETGLDTQASPNASYRNMIRSGFRLAYERPNYRRKADA